MTPERQLYITMTTKPKRATIDLDPALHKALRLRAAETERSMSDLVDEAVRLLLNAGGEDLDAAYSRMAQDEARETEAHEWSEALITDSNDETR
jgi:hypothetical protein